MVFSAGPIPTNPIDKMVKNDMGLGKNQEEVKTLIPNEHITSHAITECNRKTKSKGALVPLDDLLPDVLKWLPLESLCRFKCVSKTWCAFIMKHFHGLMRRSIVAMLYDQYNIVTPQLDCFGLCSIEAQTGIALSRWNRAVQFCNFNYRTCNGLFCWSTSFANTRLAIYNPFTQEEPLLLPRKSKITNCFSSYAFGFDPLSKKYKVFSWTNYPNCLIHTMGTKFWRRINPPSYKTGSKPHSQSACINGVVYLYCSFTNTVISFNLSRECFGTQEGLPNPIKEARISSIFEFEGCMSLTHRHANNPPKYDLWMFKNNANWVMVTSIVPPAEDMTWCKPYSIRTGEIVYASTSRDSQILYVYSILTGEYDTIKVIGLDSKLDTIRVIDYVESSQSLQDLVCVCEAFPLLS